MHAKLIMGFVVIGIGGCASSVDGEGTAAGTGASSTGIADSDGLESSTEPQASTGAGTGTTGAGSGSTGSASWGTSGGTEETGESTGPEVDSEGPSPMGTLIVSDETAGVGLWFGVSELTENVGPDVVLGGVTGTPLALMRYGARLLVATDDPEATVLFYDEIGTLTDGALPDDVLTAEAIGGVIEPVWFAEPEVWVEPDGDLWVGRYASFQRLVGGAADGSAFSGSVSFEHPWQQVVSAAVIPDTDVLVGAQISGAGIVAWNDARTAEGVVSDPSFAVLEGVMPDAVHRYGDRLVVGGDAIRIWHDAASLAEDVAPDVVLGPASGIDTRASHVFIGDDLLVASLPAGGRVAVFTGLDDLSADSTPSMVLGDALEPRRAWLDAAGDLWVVDRNGVLRYRDLLGEGELTIKVNVSAVNVTDALVVGR